VLRHRTGLAFELLHAQAQGGRFGFGRRIGLGTDWGIDTRRRARGAVSEARRAQLRHLPRLHASQRAEHQQDRDADQPEPGRPLRPADRRRGLLFRVAVGLLHGALAGA
jgi:hypothetical protein